NLFEACGFFLSDSTRPGGETPPDAWVGSRPVSDLSNRIVQKLWSYCNVLRDDGLSYQDYLEQLTFILFLKMPTSAPPSRARSRPSRRDTAGPTSPTRPSRASGSRSTTGRHCGSSAKRAGCSA